MAASRFLAGAAACKILLSFAAESGVAAWLHACDSDLSTNFLNFGVCDFPFKIPLLQNRPFFRFSAEIWFWSCNFLLSVRTRKLLC